MAVAPGEVPATRKCHMVKPTLRSSKPPGPGSSCITAVTNSPLEWTIVLRSIGARARDVRRIFATEGVALAVGGGCSASRSATC